MKAGLKVAANVAVQLSVPRVQNSPHILVIFGRGGFLFTRGTRGSCSEVGVDACSVARECLLLLVIEGTQECLRVL